jgi:hypothetical protein
MLQLTTLVSLRRVMDLQCRQHRTECGEPHGGSTDLTASASELQTIKVRYARERAALRSKEAGVEVLS